MASGQGDFSFLGNESYSPASCSKRDQDQFRKRLSYDECVPPYPDDQCKKPKVEHSLFDLLPDEIVAHVLKFLTLRDVGNFAEICKRFRTIVNSMHKVQNVCLVKRTVPRGVFGLIMNRGVIRLKASRCEILSPMYRNRFGYTLTPFKNLLVQYMDLSFATIELKDLEWLLKCCQRLRYLGIACLNLSDKCCMYIAQNQHLSSMDANMTSGITKQGIGRILRNCMLLKELNVSWANLDEEAVDVLSANIHENMEHLNISGLRAILTDHHVRKIVENVKNLKTLDISDSINVTEESVKLVAQHCKHTIEFLGVSRCFKTTPIIYYDNFLDAPKLKKLCLFGLATEEGVEALEKRYFMNRVEVNRDLFSTVARPRKPWKINVKI